MDEVQTGAQEARTAISGGLCRELGAHSQAGAPSHQYPRELFM